MIDFHGIIGHDAVKKHLCTAVRTGHVSHAYLLTGEAGMGKKTIADAFSLMLLCEKGGTEPCRSCHACRQVLAGTHPDVIRTVHEKPGSIGVDEVRSQITDTAAIRPFSAARKIYIVADADKMTVQAQNALLKTIEEPPDYAVIMLLAENEEAMLETIRSRCVKLKLRPVADEKIVSYLIAEKKLPPERAALVAGFARGNLGKALLLSSSEEFREAYDADLKILKRLPEADTEEILDDIARIREVNGDIPDFLQFVRLWFRDLMICKTEREPERLTFAAEETELKKISRRLSFRQAGAVLDETERTEDRLKANVNPDLALEMLLLKIAEKNR